MQDRRDMKGGTKDSRDAGRERFNTGWMEERRVRNDAAQEGYGGVQYKCDAGK